MIEAFDAAAVRAAEEPVLAAERGFSGGLMHRAATALQLSVRHALRRCTGGVTGTTVAGLVGPGNNGADTLYALAGLAAHGVRVLAIVTGSVHDAGLAAFRAAGGRVLGVGEGAPGPGVPLAEAVTLACGADVLLDGLLGIGARGGLHGASCELVTALNNRIAQGPPGPFVVAVDVPSGIGVDDGTVPGPVLPADLTVTFGVAKPGLLLPPAAHLAGRLEVVDLGLQGRLTGPAAVRRLERSELVGLLPIPGPGDDKYGRGVVGVVAGSPGYPGAAVLAVAGALGIGCGMVRYVGPDAVRAAVVAAHPEVVAAPGPDVRVQAWVVGPGLEGGEDHAAAALEHAIAQGLPVVVDAGGLGLLPDRVPPLVVLTPHAGELARLLSDRGVPVTREQVEAAPLRWARQAADRTGATVLLKGHTTLVVGETVYAQAGAPAWLATAGSGDVLAGLLGALLAGRSRDLADSGLVAGLAAAAAEIHGRAGALANPGGPVTASMVAAALPATVAGLLR